MVFLKACPRCKGDIYLDQDAYGSFLKCLQCGYHKDAIKNDSAHKFPTVFPPTGGLTMRTKRWTI